MSLMSPRVEVFSVPPGFGELEGRLDTEADAVPPPEGLPAETPAGPAGEPEGVGTDGAGCRLP